MCCLIVVLSTLHLSHLQLVLQPARWPVPASTTVPPPPRPETSPHFQNRDEECQESCSCANLPGSLLAAAGERVNASAVVARGTQG